jgi:hypothetical protein
MLNLYVKGECKKNPTKNNHFLHETGDTKVFEAFFWQVNCIFLCFRFFSLNSLSCIFNNFLAPPEVRFNHYKGPIALPMDYCILQKVKNEALNIPQGEHSFVHQ